MPILGTIASSIAKATNSFESIASVTVGSGGASTVSFTSIPSTYKHLQVRGYGLFSGTVGAGQFRFNSSTTGYNYHAINSDGTNTNSTTANSQSYGLWNNNAGTTSTTPVPFVIDILEYASTTKTKQTLTWTGWSPSYLEIATSQWDNTSAITSIDFTLSASSFAQNCVISLYGIKDS